MVIACGDDVGLHILGNTLGVREFQHEHHSLHNATHQCSGPEEKP